VVVSIRLRLPFDGPKRVMYQPTAAGAPWGMAEGTTRISSRTWRRVCGLAAAGFVIAALASGHHDSSHSTSPGPSSYQSPVDVSGDTAPDPAAELEIQKQASQALQDASQQRYDALQNTANSITP
jgi:hypothetical protein